MDVARLDETKSILIIRHVIEWERRIDLLGFGHTGLYSIQDC